MEPVPIVLDNQSKKCEKFQATESRIFVDNDLYTKT
jgi:hypothetical protein